MFTKRQKSALGCAFFMVVVLLVGISSKTVKQMYITVPYPRPTQIHAQRPILDTFVRETTLPAGVSAPGFVIFDRLYLRNGTLFAVSRTPRHFPETKNILSQAKNSVDDMDLDPTSKEMQIITTEMAQVLIGERATLIEGMSFLLYDTAQSMKTYYQWWGEIILGGMRVYSSLLLAPDIESHLAEPARFILPNVMDTQWRNSAQVNGPLMRAAFPSASIERVDLWKDMMYLDQTFVFERVMIISRAAAQKSSLSGVWHKMISGTMNMTVPEHFWEPLRKRLVRNTIGHLPITNNDGVIINPPRAWSDLPIVTYISRQGVNRKLKKVDHEALVKDLKDLERERLCEVIVVNMEDLKISKQIEVVARSTILVGVHGNGLTHQLWMPPSHRSTVIEIFHPRIYLQDYELLTRNMGHKHYAVWNDTTLTLSPAGEWFQGIAPENGNGLNSDLIPVYSATIATIIRKRLTEPIPKPSIF